MCSAGVTGVRPVVYGVALQMEMSLCCLVQTEISVGGVAMKSCADGHGFLVMNLHPRLFLWSHEVDIYGFVGGVLTIVVFIYTKPAEHISLAPPRYVISPLMILPFHLPPSPDEKFTLSTR